ncbi:Hypothetical_protein [Hexamita inflata]|uniref:Hypothetical_protein n=1 Tax=Hexamita inflata TaxID=28002 RepID=A0AA86NEC8_9EUKA|nr:Hypothetical protein HINF_LOCUS5634 [Hexamita inflata]
MRRWKDLKMLLRTRGVDLIVKLKTWRFKMSKVNQRTKMNQMRLNRNKKLQVNQNMKANRKILMSMKKLKMQMNNQIQNNQLLKAIILKLIQKLYKINTLLQQKKQNKLRQRTLTILIKWKQKQKHSNQKSKNQFNNRATLSKTKSILKLTQMMNNNLNKLMIDL